MRLAITLLLLLLHFWGVRAVPAEDLGPDAAVLTKLDPKTRDAVSELLHLLPPRVDWAPTPPRSLARRVDYAAQSEVVIVFSLDHVDGAAPETDQWQLKVRMRSGVAMTDEAIVHFFRNGVARHHMAAFLFSGVLRHLLDRGYGDWNVRAAGFSRGLEERGAVGEIGMDLMPTPRSQLVELADFLMAIMSYFRNDGLRTTYAASFDAFNERSPVLFRGGGRRRGVGDLAVMNGGPACAKSEDVRRFISELKPTQGKMEYVVCDGSFTA